MRLNCTIGLGQEVLRPLHAGGLPGLAREPVKRKGRRAGGKAVQEGFPRINVMLCQAHSSFPSKAGSCP